MSRATHIRTSCVQNGFVPLLLACMFAVSTSTQNDTTTIMTAQAAAAAEEATGEDRSGGGGSGSSMVVGAVVCVVVLAVAMYVHDGDGIFVVRIFRSSDWTCLDRARPVNFCCSVSLCYMFPVSLSSYLYRCTCECGRVKLFDDIVLCS